MMVISGVVTLNISTVEGAVEVPPGDRRRHGLVYLLRWYWCGVNAWSEVSAMAAALVFSLVASGASASPRRPAAASRSCSS